MRRSGKTFRVILKALYEMSSGKNVVVDCGTNDHANYVFRESMHMAKQYLGWDALDVNTSRMTLKIVGCKGSVCFTNDVIAKSFIGHKENAGYASYTDYQDK